MTRIVGVPRVIVGVDPGKSGALVALTLDGEWLGAMAMPIAGTGSKARVQAWPICDWLRGLSSNDRLTHITAAIERVHAMPQQGVTSTFSFGHATGVVYGALSASGVRVIEVSPRDWQIVTMRGRPRTNRLQLKATAVQVCYERWPESREALTQRGGKIRRESGIADAALIALWAMGSERQGASVV